MSTVHTIRLKCGCDCAHLNVHGCAVFYPDRPIEASAKEIREQAAAVGWETKRHTRGTDMCPPCRIVAIRDAAGMAKEGDA